jgi:hypothetical protein
MSIADGPDLAWNFCRSVLSKRWRMIPCHKRTAEALRDTVKEGCVKKGTHDFTALVESRVKCPTLEVWNKLKKPRL